MNYYGYECTRETDVSHHGILGMKWGKRNGPPYPLGANDHSSSKKKAGWRQSLKEKFDPKKKAKVKLKQLIAENEAEKQKAFEDIQRYKEYANQPFSKEKETKGLDAAFGNDWHTKVGREYLAGVFDLDDGFIEDPWKWHYENERQLDLMFSDHAKSNYDHYVSVGKEYTRLLREKFGE